MTDGWVKVESATGETVRQHDTRVHGVDPYVVACPRCESKINELCYEQVNGRRVGGVIQYGLWPTVAHDERAAVARAELEAGKAASQ